VHAGEGEIHETGRGEVFRSPWAVGLVVLLIYGAWLVAFFGLGHDAMDFTYRSRTLLNQSHVSSEITPDPRVTSDSGGYDSQFFYYLAVDPVNARYYMDANTYRYTRILYPMVARTLALGRPGLIPYTLILVNWLALAGGAAALAAWLRRKRVTPWFALVYGLYPGLFFGLQRDLSEPLAYGLVALAILLFDRALGNFPPPVREGRVGALLLPAAAVFAFAALTRETTALFILLYGGSLLLRRSGVTAWQERLRANWRPALLFLAIALVPLAAWKAFLLLWLGPQGDAGLQFTALPFQGIWHWRASIMTPEQMDQIRSVVIPGVLCGATAVVALARGMWRREVVVLLAHVLLFVVFVQAASYANFSGSGRISTGVVLAAVLCLPVIGYLGQRAWFWISSTLWLNLMPFWLGVPLLHFALSLVKR
jgi:hypothetical protein